MQRSLRATIAGFLVAALVVGADSFFFEEVRLLPTRAEVLEAAGPIFVSGAITPGDIELSPQEVPGVAASTVTAPSGGVTPVGTFLVGASRANLFPEPALFGGQTWQTEGCTDLDGPVIDFEHLPPIAPGNIKPSDFVGWPAASPDCIYLGGFGLGPVRPATRVGNGGVWVRSIAISNGQETFVYQIADLVGWFARYDQDVCLTNDCGILDVRQRVAAQTGIDLGDVIIASTHSHATADTYGGWGGIPDWYRNQIRDTAVASAKQAIANMEPAQISVGEVHLRDMNNERRDTYYSTADTGASWLQAITLSSGGRGKKAGAPSVIATWGTFAAHPTIVSESILHADWPGAAARRFEANYGGVGLIFEGGLGNVSVSGLGGANQEERAENTGIAIAGGLISDIAGNPRRLLSNEMTPAAKAITHPATTNPALVTLSSAGLFDREFEPLTPGAGPPCSYFWSKRGEASSCPGEDNDPQIDPELLRGCFSEGPSVITAEGAHRIDEFVVAFAPGEIFSNISEVTKERGDQTIVTMVLGQANDALGYIIQNFEYDLQGNVVGEYVAGTGEYEEVFSIDRCFGDHVLETMLEATADLGAGR